MWTSNTGSNTFHVPSLDEQRSLEVEESIQHCISRLSSRLRTLYQRAHVGYYGLKVRCITDACRPELVLAAGVAPALTFSRVVPLLLDYAREEQPCAFADSLLLGKSNWLDRLVPMPQTEPVAPPTKPAQPEPTRREPSAPPSEPKREPDPFDPDWPETRPTPPPKA